MNIIAQEARGSKAGNKAWEEQNKPKVRSESVNAETVVQEV